MLKDYPSNKKRDTTRKNAKSKEETDEWINLKFDGQKKITKKNMKR